MASLTFADFTTLLVHHFGPEIIITENAQSVQPSVTILTERIADICQFLYENEQTYMDLLECLTALDNGTEAGTLEIIYHLYSIPYEHALVLKILFPRTAEPQSLPEVPTVSHIWRTADWHEREAYDLMGISFTGHPDLRRILLPADWQGHPLRKDYTEQETYHGIQVKY